VKGLISGSIWFCLVLSFSAVLLTCGCASSSKNQDAEDSSSGAGKEDGKHKGALMPNAQAEEELVEKGIDAYDRELFTLAKENFTELQDKYPASYYAAFAELKIADCFFNLAEYAPAVTAYQEFIKLHPKHEAAPYAKFQIGESYSMQYRGLRHDQGPLRSAVKSYEALTREHPLSEYTRLARKRISECRERLAAHEADVAKFYYKQGQVEASAARYREISANYADSSTAQLTRQQVEEEFGDNPALLDFIKTGSGADRAGQKARLLTPQETQSPGRAQTASTANQAPAEPSREAATEQKPDEIAKLSEERNTAIEITSAPDQAFLLGLTCKQLGNYAAFSARFRGPVQIASRSEETAMNQEQKEEKKITALFAPATQNSSGEDADSVSLSFQPVQCSTAGLRIVMQEYFRREQRDVTPSSSIVKLFASVPAQTKLELLVLEQPYRVVGIIPLRIDQNARDNRTAQ
jgi:outer membrane protein assembly factor BamD